MYRVTANSTYLYKLLEKIPSLHVMNTGEMDEYINDFLSKYFEIFIYSGILVIFSSMLFLINGIQVHILSKKKEILILKSLGANDTDIYKTYILEGILLGVINIILAVIVGNKISKFFITNIAQKEYNFQYFSNILLILLSIIIMMIIYWLNVKKF